jgi:hypothetical protein
MRREAVDRQPYEGGPDRPRTREIPGPAEALIGRNPGYLRRPVLIGAHVRRVARNWCGRAAQTNQEEHEMDSYLPTISDGEFWDEAVTTHAHACRCRRCATAADAHGRVEMPTLEDLGDIYMLLGTALMAVDYVASLYDELAALGLVKPERL